jgi:hypothetical protein
MNTTASSLFGVLTIVVLCVFFIFVAIQLFGSTKSDVLGSIEATIMDPFLELSASESADDLPSLSSSADFIDPDYATYAQELTELLFDTESFSQQHPGGFITIDNVPPRGQNYPENILLRFQNYERELNGREVTGVSVQLGAPVQGELDEPEYVYALVASPKTHPYLENKSLCVLPKGGSGTDALFALHEITAISMDNYAADEAEVNRFRMNEMQAANQVDELVITLNEDSENSFLGYPIGQEFIEENFADPSQQRVLFLHYENQVCFFPVYTGFKMFGGIDYEDGELNGEDMISKDLALDLPQNANYINRGTN